jgi:hypothetical protein
VAMGDISYDCSLEDVVLMGLLTRLIWLKLGPLSRIEKAAVLTQTLMGSSDLKHFSISN